MIAAFFACKQLLWALTQMERLFLLSTPVVQEGRSRSIARPAVQGAYCYIPIFIACISDILPGITYMHQVYVTHSIVSSGWRMQCGAHGWTSGSERPAACGAGLFLEIENFRRHELSINRVNNRHGHWVCWIVDVDGWKQHNSSVMLRTKIHTGANMSRDGTFPIIYLDWRQTTRI